MAHPPSTSHLVELEERPNLRVHVTRALRAAIVTGELTAGEVYSAPALAATLGTSATPVREAMIDLAREGLVVAVPNKGYRVLAVSEEDLDEITAVRMILEPAGLRDAVPCIPAEDIGELHAMAQAMVAAASADDLTPYLNADREFHIRLLTYGGNRRLVEIVSDLRSQTRLYGMPHLAARHELVKTASEHVELVDLIAAGDAAGAEALMRRHLAHVRGSWALPAARSGAQGPGPA